MKIIKILALACFTCLQIAQMYSQSVSKSTGLYFIENKGQVTDENFVSHPEVLFYCNTGGLNALIKSNGFSYMFFKEECETETDLSCENLSKSIPRTKAQRIDFVFLNQDAIPSKEMTNLSAFKFNFYQEHCPDGVLNVPCGQNIKLNNIYKGIDVKWYWQEGRLKYDYIVHKAIDYTKIRLRVDGADRLYINASGQLCIESQLGTILEDQPIVIQNGKKLIANWKVQGLEISFDIQNFKLEGDLIIDPSVLVRNWSTFSGGGGADYITGIEVDKLGNVTTWGSTNFHFTSFISNGTFQNNYSGNYDTFIMRYDANGNLIWGTYYGSSINEFSSTCALDTAGNLFVYGELGIISYSTSAVLASPNAFKATSTGVNVFLAKFGSNGQRLWGTYYGGNNGEKAHKIITDKTGNVYFCGRTSSADSLSLSTSGAFQTHNNGGQDGFIAKFSGTGNRIWATYLGGTMSDIFTDMVLDAENNLVLVGHTTSSVGITTPGSAQPQFLPSSSEAALIAKFDTNGNRLWASYFAGNQLINAKVVTDQNSNIYFWNGASSSGIATPGCHQSTGTPNDCALVKFNKNGIKIWGTYYGGNWMDVNANILIDNKGYIFITGYTYSDTVGRKIATIGAYQEISYTMGFPGDQYHVPDGFIVKFDSMGVRQWGSYYGGLGSDKIMCSAIDNANNFYVVGETAGSTNMISPGCFQPVYGGSLFDGFVSKFSATELYVGLNEVKDNSFEVKLYPNPNKGLFTVELSDEQNSEKEYAIYDLLGRELFSLKSCNNLQTFNLSEYETGIYLLSIKIENKKLVTKYLFLNR
jgi:predicted SpoU family rRNA methylase